MNTIYAVYLVDIKLANWDVMQILSVDCLTNTYDYD